MVRLEKDYVFDGPNGEQSLKALFEGRRQLIVFHFMFDPAWDTGCSGCTSYVDALGDLSLLDERDTRFVIISHAPLTKIDTYKARKAWRIPWLSSFGSDINYDFHVTLDHNIAPAAYNYCNKAESVAGGHRSLQGLKVHARVAYTQSKDNPRPSAAVRPRSAFSSAAENWLPPRFLISGYFFAIQLLQRMSESLARAREPLRQRSRSPPAEPLFVREDKRRRLAEAD
jgi:predicted dithiol-disulfide oxidoreductase (DUF899 family)